MVVTRSRGQSEAAPDQKNIWREALAKTKNAERFKDGTLIVLGEPNSGKSEFVQTVVESAEGYQNQSSDNTSYLLNYNYIPIRDEDDGEILSHMNMWEVSDPDHLKLLESVMKPETVTQLSYLIILNCAKPETLKESFDKWIKFIEEMQGTLTKELQEEQKKALQESISRYVQFYRDPEDNESAVQTEEERAEIDTDFSLPKNNYGCPIIVVCANTENFQKKSSEADRVYSFEALVNYVQHWCKDYSAASFTILTKQREQARRIITYAIHRMEPKIKFNESPKVFVNWSNLEEEYLLCPSGFSLPEVLAGQTLETPFEEYFPPSKKDKKASSARGKLVAEQDEQVFLRGLSLDLNEEVKPGSEPRRQEPRKPAQTFSREQSNRKETRQRGHKQKERGERNRDRQRRRSTRNEDSSSRKTQSDTQRDAVTRFFNHLLKDNTGNNSNGSSSSSNNRSSSDRSRGNARNTLRALETLRQKRSSSKREQ